VNIWTVISALATQRDENVRTTVSLTASDSLS